MKESEIRDPKVLNEYIALVNADVQALFDPQQFEEIPCPICGSIEYTQEFEKVGFHYVTCRHCGTLYANPRPSQAQLGAFYSNSVSSKFWVEKFFTPFAEARREKIFKPRAEDFVREFSQFRDKRIGDVGAGFGLFLEELHKLWPKADLCAIEPSADMVQICKDKGLSVVPKMFEDLSEQDGTFDVLCAYELFEHLCAPDTFLQKANASLSMGGCLLMTTLNGQGFDIQLLWEEHKNINPPHHLNFINPAAIRILLERCGFSVDSITTPGRLDWDIVERNIVDEHVQLGRWWNTVCGLDEEAKAELQAWISKHNLSSHLRVVARKVRELV